jgi:hypothetical protein
MKEPITFENKDGNKLFGIVHIPKQSPLGEKKVGINLLNPGIKYRVAPNRLNVKLARKLCQNGYYVLRFDPCGIGDSEGELLEGVLVADIWEKIQTGLFVSDTIAANDFFIKNYEVNELILMGSCGGAITSLLTSAKDHRVDALCLIDIPVSLRTATMSFADKVAEGGEKVDLLFSEYIKNIFNLNSWYRFITLKTEFRALSKIFRMKFQKSVPFRREVKIPQNIEDLCREKKLNKLFFEAFEAFSERKKPILFALAGADSGTEIFKNYFQDTFLKLKYPNSNYKDVFQVFEVENANHVYTLYEWQLALINRVCSWINEKD